MWTTSRIISTIDLTDLSSTATEYDTDRLCRAAATHDVAAVCVWPRFVQRAAQRLVHTPVRVATVVNFPHGNAAVEVVRTETETALGDGAHEIDVVIPHAALLDGDLGAVSDVLAAVVETARQKGALVKAILETGVLEVHGLVPITARLAVDAGVDFLKTSTGKTDRGASLQSAWDLLRVAEEADRPVGVKISGGVRTRDDAERYLYLAAAVRGLEHTVPSSFRFGASGLLEDLLGVDPSVSTARERRRDY